MSEELRHYGILRRSGRYPYGSGGFTANPKTFLGQVEQLRKSGMSEVEIAKGFGMTTSQLRAQKSIARKDSRTSDVAMAIRLKEKGYSTTAIGAKMGINESSVRSLLNPTIQERTQRTDATAELLRNGLKENPYLDVGGGVENRLGISRTRLKTAIAMLEAEGYVTHEVLVDQLGTANKKTKILVIGPEGTTYKDIVTNKDGIGLLNHYTEDGGRTYLGIKTPIPVSRDRIHIRYAEDGGAQKDGIIELRMGVDDISLGNSKYAQVRIAVDGGEYLKGMAMYSDEIPKGKDIIFNTTKTKDSPGRVFKEVKADDDNPFGATVRQRHYIDKNGKEKLSTINIVNEEGDWNKWSKTLSSQMLSKQSPQLAKKQLGIDYDIRKEEFDRIMELTNPAVRKKLLDTFADSADSAAVNLKAAAMPRQRSQVILPVNGMSDREVYAPNFRDGERVALIRHPHGGTFEIPELTVNNRHPRANKIMKNAKDAIGISAKVAERLSGADFDGDSVLVIPTDGKKIKTTSPLKGLQNFDPKKSYPKEKGMKVMSATVKQQEMGKISNLITDMTIKGATTSEIAAAVRHSMVVIDAEKHELNYKKSAIDNNISSLKQKYQGKSTAGASTLISRSSSEQRVRDRKTTIDKATGKKVHEEKPPLFIDKKGKAVYKTVKSSKMMETSDARTLSSGTPMESIYADYANQLKSLANQARKASVNTKTTPYSPSAKKAYDKEVTSLNAKLSNALRNRPVERQAQLIGNSIYKMKTDANPDLTKDEKKRLKWQALNEARTRAGAKKPTVSITQSEWDAIQAGAISNNALTKLLDNADLSEVKAYATPRNKKGVSAATASKARNMQLNGYTQSEIADQLGISLTTIQEVLD